LDEDVDETEVGVLKELEVEGEAGSAVSFFGTGDEYRRSNFLWFGFGLAHLQY